MRSIQQRFQKMMGFAPCVFYGRGLTSVQSLGFLPYARPITTVGEHCLLGQRGPPEGGGVEEDDTPPWVVLENNTQLVSPMSQAHPRATSPTFLHSWQWESR